MNKRDILPIGVLLLIAWLIMQNWFGYIYPDSRHYMQMLDSLLGRGLDVGVRSPFMFRILVPWLSIPLGLLMPSEYAISTVSALGALGLVVVMFYICKEFTENNVAPYVVTWVLVGTLLYVKYSGVPLTDSISTLFIALIILGTLRGWKSENILALVLIGVLAKEAVLFGALFHILYKKSKASVLIMIGGIAVIVLVRIVLAGSIYQPLFNIHEPQYWVERHTVDAMIGIVAVSTLAIVAWVRYDERLGKAMRLLVYGTIAFMPYLLMGVYVVWYEARFLWPLQLAFLGVATVGVSSSYEAIRKRTMEALKRSD